LPTPTVRHPLDPLAVGGLAWYEAKYGINIHRVPHPMLSTWLKWGIFRKENYSIAEISFADMEMGVEEMGDEFLYTQALNSGSLFAVGAQNADTLFAASQAAFCDASRLLQSSIGGALKALAVGGGKAS
jgi:hypothetical protein